MPQCWSPGEITNMIPETANTAAVKRACRLEYLTVGWNCLEGVIAVAAGLIAGSIALVGFGFDSAIEVSSGLVLLWRLNYKGSPAAEERIEAVKDEWF